MSVMDHLAWNVATILEQSAATVEQFRGPKSATSRARPLHPQHGRNEVDMAARALWKGHLRLSLVTIPIRVYPATNPGATIHFNQLHRECLTRIQYRKWCPTHNRAVANDEIVKGYEFERGRYVALEEADIAKVRPESTRVINLRQFASAAALDPMLLEQPYYLAPDGKVAAESFAVMREALRGQAAIGTVAFHGREQLVAIAPRDDALVMFVLRHEGEIRTADAISELDDVPAKVKAEEVALAKKVMGGFDTAIDFSKYRDSYEEALRAMIDRKIEGEEIVATPEAPQPKVVNLMDALRRSLDEVSASKKRPARAAAAKPRRDKPPKPTARKRAS
jgi:DNA end-binding protein Ku